MLHTGPTFDPTPANVSIWDWLFQGESQPSQKHGFRDAHTGKFLSHHQGKEAAEDASLSLSIDHNVRSLDTVSILARNSISYVLAFFASVRLRATVAPLPPVATEEDLAYLLEASSTRLIFVEPGLLDNVKRASERLGSTSIKIVLLDGSSGDVPTLELLIQRGKTLREKAPHILEPLNNRQLARGFLCFTSGTTGKPKPVIISHSNIINQLRQVQAFTPAKSSPAVVLGILPFYHITGLVHLIQLTPACGQDLVIMTNFDMKAMMEAIVHFRCTELWLVPPLLIRLLNDKTAQGYDLSHVEQFNTGAAPLTDQVIQQLSKRFPRVRIRQAWGMTETTSCLTLTPPDLMTWTNASKVGKLVPGTSVRFADPETGEAIPKGSTGEIWAKGPQITAGYLNRPTETASSYGKDGFFRTGDLGSISEDGFITIHDRLKEMIKVRGHAVAPAELEDLLLGIPVVADAAVIGIPHDYSGEVPRAFVVVHNHITPSELLAEQMSSFVKARKPKYKCLAGGIDFVESIPKSPSGKILRRTLRDRWLASVKVKDKIEPNL